MAGPNKDMEFILRTKAEGDGAEKTVEGLDKVAQKTEEVSRKTVKAAKTEEQLAQEAEKRRAADREFYRKMSEEDNARWAAEAKRMEEERKLKEERRKQREAERQQKAPSGPSGPSSFEELLADPKTVTFSLVEWTNRSKDATSAVQETIAEIEKETEAIRKLGDTGETVADRQKREWDQQQQRLRDLGEAKSRLHTRELAQAREADQAQMASIALRGASILAITKLASEAARQVQEVTQEAEKLGVAMPDSVKATGMAIEAIMNPSKFILDTISANTRKVIEDLKKAQEAVKATKDILKVLQAEKRQADSAFATNAIASAFDREMKALKSLNDERERQQRIAGNRQSNERSRENVGTQQQIDLVRRTKDGAAETFGVAQIEGQAAERELARQQQDQARQLDDARAKAMQIGQQLDAAISQTLAFQNQLDSAREAEKKAYESRFTNPDGFSAAKTTREEKESAVKGAQSTEDALAAQLEEAQGAIRELVAMSADNQTRMLQEFGDALSKKDTDISGGITELAKEALDSAAKAKEQLEGEGKKVSGSVNDLIKKVTDLLEDEVPDEKQLVEFQQAVILLKTSQLAMVREFSTSIKDDVAMMQQMVTELQAVKAQKQSLQVQLERIRAQQ